MAESASGFDRELLTRTRLALDAWEATGEGPTSALTGSGAVEALERRFAELCAVRYALALPTGTLALRFALAAAGVGAGDEVLVPALDWPAAAAAVLSLNARPRAVDCAADAFLVDPGAIGERITARVKALVVTHLAGLPAAAREIGGVCAAHGIAMIEDASQALGTTLDGRQVGGFGTAGVFSLGPGKLIDAGEGGVLVTDDELVYREATRLSQSPVRQLVAGIHPPDPCALAARIHPLAAILALAGLSELETELRRRRLEAEQILSRARSISRLRIPAENAAKRFSWTCVPAIVAAACENELNQAELVADPLGTHLIPQVLGEATDQAPNASRLATRLRRLQLDRSGPWEKGLACRTRSRPSAKAHSTSTG
jgi:dTDP-4-amino-4,6-dideoxygalactose transaminase